jgi:hypothetical protein
MIIKNINDLVTIFTTNLMAFNLLIKCHKEEAPTGVVAAVGRCMKGTIIIWALYLLNLFLKDCRDAHDS